MSGSSFAWFADNRLIPGPPVFTTRISRSFMSGSLAEKHAACVYVVHEMEVSFWRFDWPAFLRASETGQTKRLKCTYAVTHSTSVPEPRSTSLASVHATADLLCFAPVSGTLAQCFSFISESCRSAPARESATSSRQLWTFSRTSSLAAFRNRKPFSFVRHHPLIER